MLLERGIDNASYVSELAPCQAVWGAILWWDVERECRGRVVRPGLLVHVIKHGGKPGYRPAPSPLPATGTDQDVAKYLAQADHFRAEDGA